MLTDEVRGHAKNIGHRNERREHQEVEHEHQRIRHEVDSEEPIVEIPQNRNQKERKPKGAYIRKQRARRRDALGDGQCDGHFGEHEAHDDVGERLEPMNEALFFHRACNGRSTRFTSRPFFSTGNALSSQASCMPCHSERGACLVIPSVVHALSSRA